MARTLFGTTLSMQRLHFLPPSVTLLIVLTAIFSVFSVVTFLCGSHGGKKENRTVRLGGKKKPVIEKMKSSLSSKALLMGKKMISWRKLQVQDDQGEAENHGPGVQQQGEDGALWKKTIIKGEKCRPLDFSGKILYDCDGNLLQD